MQEMMELSKLQTIQLDDSPQSVTFPIRDATGIDQVLTVQAGPSQFGRNLKGDQKVTARTIIIHPFRACGDHLTQSETIRGKIAIMERGECMFVEKARKVQKYGAVGAIIIDNTPGSNAASSPMFSMSGDGTDDVNIPTVFLFAADAAKLLFALSRDAGIEVTIAEHKNGGQGGDEIVQSEEESMFYKLKVSVQEFLNKHTGIAFTKVVQIGKFKAHIGNEKIKITYQEEEEEDDDDAEKDLGAGTTSPQWTQVRKDLLKSIFTSENKELYVPLNILRIYYQTLSDETMEEKKNQDTVKQAEWLLKQLAFEYDNKQDSLIKTEENVKVLSILTDLSHLTNDKDNDLETKETLKALNSILESVTKEIKMKKDTIINDDLVVRDVKKDSSENSDRGGEQQAETKVNRAVDEL